MSGPGASGPAVHGSVLSGPVRVLAVADSDSYVKWAAATLDALPPLWRAAGGHELVVLRSPVTPSVTQVRSAVAGTSFRVGGVPVVGAGGLVRRWRRLQPDVVLLAATGPVVQVVARDVLRIATAGRPRPVLVSGLPGVSVPATTLAWHYRQRVDLLVVHSLREAEEFRALAAAYGRAGEVGTARLPFLPRTTPRAGGREVVFAAQAKVPADPADRVRLLHSLARLARTRPDLDVVVKLRAAPGEQQTHAEQHPYPQLWAALGAPGPLRFSTAPLGEHLAAACGLVTVSSTAALEAMAARVPVLLLEDFGSGPELLGAAFAGSGCAGRLADLEAGRFRAPDPSWLRRNYLHPDEDCDAAPRLGALVHRRRAGGLPPVPEHQPGPGLRPAAARARLLLPGSALARLRVVRRLSRRAARALRAVAA